MSKPQAFLSRRAVKEIVEGAANLRDHIICAVFYFCELRVDDFSLLNVKDFLERDGKYVLVTRHEGEKVLPEAVGLELVEHTKGFAPENPLFRTLINPGGIGGKRMSPSDAYRVVRAAGERVGHKASPYMLAHAHWVHSMDEDKTRQVIRIRPVPLGLDAGLHSTTRVSRGRDKLPPGSAKGRSWMRMRFGEILDDYCEALGWKEIPAPLRSLVQATAKLAVEVELATGKLIGDPQALEANEYLKMVALLDHLLGRLGITRKSRGSDNDDPPDLDALLSDLTRHK